MNPPTCIRWLAAVTIFLSVSSVAEAQAIRFDSVASTTSAQCASGKQCPILALSGTQVNICGGAVTTLATCLATPATTYTNAGAGTTCATTSQLTPQTGGACLATSDNQGNFGMWILPGSYNYFLRVPATAGGGTYGPYPINIGASSGCPLGATCDASYATLALACTAAGTGTLYVTRSWNALTTASYACNMEFLGNGKLNVAVSNTVTLAGIITAPAGQQIFTAAGSGSSGSILITGKVPVVSASWWGASNAASLSQASAAAAGNSNGSTLLISTPFTALTTATLTASLEFSPGGSLQPASGQTVTISSKLGCLPTQKCFDLSASGSIVFSSAPPMVTPYQFGAIGDGAADDTRPVNGATTSICATGGTVYRPPGTFIVSGTGAVGHPILPVCSNIRMEGTGLIKIKPGNGSFYSLFGTTGATISNFTLSGPVDGNSANNPLVSCPDLQTKPRILYHSGAGGTDNSVEGLDVTNWRGQWGIFMVSANSRIINNTWEHVGGGSVVCDSSLLYMEHGADGGLVSGNILTADAPNTPMAVTGIETHDNVLTENNTITNFSSGIVPAQGATTVSPAAIGNKIKGALSGIRFFSYDVYGATGCGIKGGVAKANSIILNQLAYLGGLDAGNGVTLDSSSNLPFCDMAINDNDVTYDLSTGASDDFNVSDAGIGYVQSNAGGGCYRCDVSRNTISNAPVDAVRMTADGSDWNIQNIKATNPGSSLNTGLNSAFRAGIFVSTFSAPVTGQINVSGANVSDTLNTCRFGYGVEMATVNTSGIVADGVSVSAKDLTCTSLVKGIAPNSGTQLPYIRAILNVPSAKVLPGIATATNSTYTSLQEGIVYTWNGAQYTSFVPHNGTPVASACGTNPAVGGNDRAGAILVGTSGGAVTSCTITFALAFTGAAYGPISLQNAVALVWGNSISTTAITLTAGAGQDIAGKLFEWAIPSPPNN